MKRLLVLAALTLTATAAHAQLTSAEIGTLATIAAIDKSEILVSVVATNKDVSSDVSSFAKMMVDQHGSNLNQILDIASTQHVTSLSGGQSDQLANDGKKDLVKLGGLNGKEFDQAYVNAMVNGHEAALKLIDTKLMKTAKSEEIKKFLTDTRAAVVTHLEHAKKLQEAMKA